MHVKFVNGCETVSTQCPASRQCLGEHPVSHERVMSREGRCLASIRCHKKLATFSTSRYKKV